MHIHMATYQASPGSSVAAAKEITGSGVRIPGPKCTFGVELTFIFYEGRYV